MAFKFNKPVEEYANLVTPEMLKDAFEEYGFEVEMKETLTVGSTTFRTYSLEGLLLTQAELNKVDIENYYTIMSETTERTPYTRGEYRKVYFSEHLTDEIYRLLKNKIKRATQYKASRPVKPVLLTERKENEIPEYRTLNINELEGSGVV